MIVVANQKGGVGKTSISTNLAAALAGFHDKRVMLVDFDGQRNATQALLGFTPTEGPDVADVIRTGLPLMDAARPCPHAPNLLVVPGSTELAYWEKHISAQNWDVLVRESRALLKDTAPADVDYVLFDSPPSLGLWLQAALASADGVLIVAECAMFSVEGMRQLSETLDRVRRGVNPELTVDGLILNRARLHTSFQGELAEAYRKRFGNVILEPAVPVRSIIERSQAEACPIEFFRDRHATEVRDIFRALSSELISRRPTSVAA